VTQPDPAGAPPAAGSSLPRLRAAPTGAEAAGGLLAGAEGADVLAVPVAPSAAGEEEGPEPRPGTADASVAYGVDLAAVCEAATFTGRAGAVLRVPVAPGGPLPPRLLLVGVGDGGPRDLRRAGAGLARAVRGTGRLATTAAALADPEGVRALAEGLLLASWSPPRTGTTEGPPPPVAEVVLLGVAPTALEGDPLGAASRASAATWLARDLTATPADVATPSHLAERASALARAPRLSVEVLDERALREGGYGGVLAVGAAAAQAGQPPRLVVARYQPDHPATGAPGLHVVLAGKGVTFDTGGLSVKPRESMVAMKTDMAGAAVVLAVVAALAEDGTCPHRVTALAPFAENALGAASYRPGDVVTAHGGRTVEVANTDAEGRLLLADALAVADAQLEPDVLVDVATLTGAATLGLGRRHAALYTDDDALAASLEVAGAATGERVWRMPLVEDYLPSLLSEVADLRHVPAASPGAGSVTAALFLREFAGARRWAHLDVAGPARAEEDEHEVVAGATGFGARLLLRWLDDLPAAG
jgi:leucyl aminopeptidase